MKRVSNETPQPGRVRKGRLTCWLIFLPLIGTILVMLAFVVLVGGAGVLSDRTFELKRGGFWHRMLIGQPLIEYPEELVPGNIRYFYSTGEVGPPSTSVVIESAEIQEGSFGPVRIWLESKGFTVQSGGSKSDRQFRHPNGQSANVMHERHRMVIRISDSW